MSNTIKSYDELLLELQELKKENESLKILYKENIPLRQKSEELLNRRDKASHVSTIETDNQKLIHELQVHQIELAMQNEELLIANNKAEFVSEKYTELYDFAPIGYFTLSKDGDIIELNHSGAKMLGKDFYRLKKSRFGFFVYKDTKPIFNAFLEKVFISKIKESCELILISYSSSPKYIYLTGIVSENSEQCLVSATDITERKQIEEALKESNSKLETAMDFAKMAWWEMEIVTGNVVFDKRKTDMLGYSKDSFKHYKDFTDLVHPDDYDRTMYAMQGHLDGLLDKYEVDYRIKTKSGEYKWFYDLGYILKEETNGKPIKLIGLVIDITARKLAEESLKESEEKYRKDLIFLNSIIESPIDIIIFSIDRNYCYTKFTEFHKKTMKNIWGIDIHIGLNMLDIIKDPEDKQKAKNNFDKVLEGEYFVLNEEYGDKALYRTFYDDYYAPIRNFDGNIVGVSVFVVDVTDRKRAEGSLSVSEEKYRILSENTSDGVSLFEENKVKYVSKGYLTMFGYDRNEIENISFDEIFSFIHPEDSKHILAVIETAHSQLKKSFQYSYRVKSKKGGNIWVEDSVNVEYDSFGNHLRSIIHSRNITDRKLAEEALLLAKEKAELNEAKVKEQARLLEIIFAHSLESIVLLDKDYNFIKVSETYAKACQKVISEFNGKNHFELYPSNLKEEFDECKKNKSIFKKLNRPFEFPDHPEFGVTHWNLELVPIIENNHIEMFLFTLKDVTEIFRFQQVLKESEEKYRLLFETINEGVALNEMIFDENDEMIDYRILEVNKAFYSTADYSSKQVINNVATKLYGMSSDFIKSFWKNHKEKYNTVYSEILSPLNNKWFYISTSPFKSNTFVTVFFDITERKLAEEKLKESEERLKEIFDNSLDNIFVIDVIQNNKFKVKTINNALEKMSNRSKNEIEGKFIDEIFPENIYKLMYNNYKNCIDKGEIYNYEEITLINNEENYYSTNLVPIFNEGGKVCRIIGISRNITDRKLAEIEIQMQNVALAELNASKDKFFSIIAHDLKSPFNGFLGLTKMMAENVSDFSLKELQDISKSMQTSASNLYNLLENLLEWSRMQRRQTQFNPKLYNLYSILKNNIAVVSEFAKQKEIELNTNVPEGFQITADEQMLNTVLRNLISNSIKFTSRGGKVEIGAMIQPYEGFKPSEGSIVIYVKDNGIGMSADTISKLFKLDLNVSRPGTNNEKGTGLGLILCKDFIEKHGGKIWVESEVGKGSTFYFTL
jgi:PAS domain S-box-containing protein